MCEDADLKEVVVAVEAPGGMVIPLEAMVATTQMTGILDRLAHRRHRHRALLEVALVAAKEVERVDRMPCLPVCLIVWCTPRSVPRSLPSGAIKATPT